ncbi:MAG: hypothetical protein ACTS5Y_00900 [Pollutimonas bauzanensis]
MNEWKVTKPRGITCITVKAPKAATTPAGVLVLTESDGLLVRAFAPGEWTECELVKQGSHGYGG